MPDEHTPCPVCGWLLDYSCIPPCNCDSDGTATAAANEDLPVPQDCQARAGGIAQGDA
jgi:hypothetical protein